MKIHEEIKKASTILKLSAKEKRKYLRKIDCSNNIHEYEDVCQELASMLIEYSSVKLSLTSFNTSNILLAKSIPLSV